MFTRLQWETNCSTQTLQKFLDALRDGDLGRLVRKKVAMPKRVKEADKKLKKMAGTKRVILHGCTGCHNKVWGPEDPTDICDLCGARRFDSRGKPKEAIVHFPLTSQFKSLLQTKQYRRAIRWECRRKKPNAGYMCGALIISFCNTCISCICVVR